MREEQALRAGVRRRRERLVDAEVTAGLAVVGAAIERRLTDEEIACRARAPPTDRVGPLSPEYAIVRPSADIRKPYVSRV